MVRCVTAAILAALLVFAPGPSRADTLLTLWYDATARELEAAEFLIGGVHAEIRRLERELAESGRSIADNPDCADLDCRQLRALSSLIGEADAAARGAFVLSTVAERQRARYADNLRGTINALRRGADDLRGSLFRQQLSVALAELTANIVASAMLGQPAIGLYEGSAKLASVITNFAINRQANPVVGNPDIGNAAVGLTGADRAGPVTESIVRSLSSQLSAVAVIEPRTAGVTLADGSKATRIVGVRGTFKPRVGNMTSSSLASMVTRAVIRAVTDGATEEMKANVASALANLDGAVKARRDALLITTLQKLMSDRIAGLRAGAGRAFDKLAALQGNCRIAAAAKSCDEELKRAEKAAAATRARAAEAHLRARQAAQDALDTQRRDWEDALARAAAAHDALRGARDRLAQGERLHANRARIETLAERAADPAARARYRDELQALDRLGDPANLRAEAARLETAREQAWTDVTLLEQALSEAGQQRLAALAAADAAIARAEAAYDAAMTAATNRFIDCISASQPVARTVSYPGLAELRRDYPGDLFPDDVMRAMNHRLDALLNRVSVTAIGVRLRDRAECRPAARPSIAGCYVEGGGADSRVWHLTGGGDAVSVAVHAKGRALYRLAGVAKGDVLDLVAATSADVAAYLRAGGGPASVTDPAIALARDFGYRLRVARTEDGDPVALNGGGWRYVPELRPVTDPDPVFTPADPLSYNGYRPIVLDWAGARPASLQRLAPGPLTAARAMSEGYGKALPGLRQGAPLRLEVAVSDRCPVVADHLTVEVTPNANPAAATLVRLTETGLATGVFRASPDGVALALFPDGFTEADWRGAFGGRRDAFTVDVVVPDAGDGPPQSIPVVDWALPKAGGLFAAPVLMAPPLRPAIGFSRETFTASVAGVGPDAPPLVLPRVKRHRDKLRGRADRLFLSWRNRAQAELRHLASVPKHTDDDIWLRAARAQADRTQAFADRFSTWEARYRAAVARAPDGETSESRWAYQVRAEMAVLYAMADDLKSRITGGGYWTERGVVDELRQDVLAFYEGGFVWLTGANRPGGPR